MQTKRFAYLAAVHRLIPRGQFGGVMNRCTTDALMSFTHDIEAAWRTGRVTSALTFDITGVFDNISHTGLINLLFEMGFPVPMVQMVRSFVSDREVAVLLDGKIGQMRAVKIGVPQGSPCHPSYSSCSLVGSEPLLTSIVSTRRTSTAIGLHHPTACCMWMTATSTSLILESRHRLRNYCRLLWSG